MASSAALDLVVNLKDNASAGLSNIAERGSFLGRALEFATGGAILGGLKAVAGGVAGVASSMIKGNAEFETYQTQFGVLLGSADAAKQRLAELAKFGASTPFELPELVRADKVLTAFGLDSATTAKQFGVSAQQIRTTIGDVAAGTGTNFEELSVTFGKFASGATGEAIARFQELGIATRQQMASWGLEFSKSGQLLTPVDQAFGVLEKNVRAKFGGMMDAQSQTFDGMLSNLKDWAGATMRTMGAPLFDAIKPQLQNLLTILSGPAVQGAIQAFAQTLATGIGTAMTWLTAGIDVIKGLVEAAQNASSIGEAFSNIGTVILTQFGVPLTTARSVMDGLVATITQAIVWVQGLTAAFQTGGLSGAIAFITTSIAQAAPLILQNLQAWGQAFIDWIAPMIPPLLATLGGLISQLWAWITAQTPALVAQLVTWGQAFVDWIGPMIPPFLATLGGLASQLWAWISAQAAPLLAQLGLWAQAFIAWIPGAITNFLQQWPDMLSRFLTWIGGAVGPLIGQFLLWAGAFIGWIVPMIPDFIVALGGLAVAIGIWIFETAQVIGTKLGEWAIEFWQWLDKNDVPSKVLGVLGNLLAQIGAWIATAASEIGAKAMTAGSRLVQGIQDGISSAWVGLVTYFRGKLAELRNMLPFSEPKDPNSPLRGLIETGATIIQMIQAGIDQEKLDLKPERVKVVETFSSVIKSATGAITDILDADLFKKLENFTTPTGPMIQKVVRALELMVIQLEEAAQGFNQKGLDAASMLGEAAGKVLGGIKTAFDFLSNVEDLKDLPAFFFQKLVYGIDQALINLQAAAAGFTTEGLAQATTFATAVGQIIGPIKAAYDLFSGLQTIEAIPNERMQALAANIYLAVYWMGEIAKGASETGVAAAVAFSEAVGSVFAGMKAGVDVITGLKDMEAIPAERLDAFFTFFQLALARAVQLGTAGGAMLEQAIIYQKQMEAVRDAYKAAADAMKSIEGAASQMNLPALPPQQAQQVANMALGGGYGTTRIPGFADGVRNFRGGWAWTGEHGPELVNLPRGSNVYSNQQSTAPNSVTINIDARGSTTSKADIQSAVDTALRAAGRRSDTRIRTT